MTEPIIKWLNKKRSSSAGWGSTVDTLLATESLLKWSAKFGEDFQEIEGGVAMEVESRQGRRSIVVNNLNDVIALDSSTKDINVEAKGRGLALVQLVSTFSTTSQHVIKNEFDVNAFNLEPRVEFQTIKFMSQQEVNQILVLSCQRWNCQKDLSVSGPAILTMKVPTGYMMDSEELSRIKKTGYNAWVENGKVVIFFHRLTPDYECVNFTLRQHLPVARMSPYIPLEIRDWYSPERRNTTLIFLPQLNTISVCEACASSECQNCRPLSNISGLKGSQISKGTRKLSTSTSLILILLLVPAIMLSEFYN